MGGQRQSALTLSPPWLQRGAAAGDPGVGGPYMYNLGLASDALIDKMYQGIQAWMPGKGTYTALPYIGNDRVLVQGPAEPNAHFATRCKQAFITWSFAGAPRAKLNNLVGYLTGLSSPRPYVLQVNNVGTWDWYAPTDDETQAPEHFHAANWNWDGTAAWWRIWVIIGNGPWVAEGNWGDGSIWGDDPANLGSSLPGLGWNGAWGPVVGPTTSGPATFVQNNGPPKWWPQAEGWGSTATLAEVLAIRTIIATWKGAHAYVPNVIIRLNDSHLGPYNAPGAPMPDGTWKNFGRDSGGNYIPARDQTARFWTQVT